MSKHDALTLTLQGVADTVRLGTMLASSTPDGTTIGFTGTLGAGKTRLIQALAVANGVEEGSVTSPTYVLCHIYHGSRLIYHIDAYRLADSDEFLELGVDEMFESAGLTLVEWADRVEDVLPNRRLNIDLQITSKSERRATIAGHEDFFPLLTAIADSWTA